MADLKEWTSYSEPVDTEWQQFVHSAGGAPDLGKFPSIEAMRNFLSESKKAMTASMGPSISGIKEEKDHQVPMRDGHKITVRTYHPESTPSAGSPLYVIYHGGGFCIGGLENEELLCRLVCAKFGAVCVNVDYRLAPEYKFPFAAEDCYDATKWAAENAQALGADPSQGFIIGGTSAGGNLTAVVAYQWRDNETSPPTITGMHQMIPALCDRLAIPEKYKDDYKSLAQNRSADVLPVKAMDLFSDNYIPNHEHRKDPRFSPLLAGTHGLPPAYFQICGADPLRDEALIYERSMRQDHGIPTKVDMYPGLPHGFWSIAPKMQVSEKFVRESVEGVGWLLRQVRK